MQVVDGFHRPPASALDGYEGALCYLYNVIRAEIDALHNAGKSVGFIGEHDTLTVHPVLQGAKVGSANGLADYHTLQDLGVPVGRGICSWATADTDVPPAKFNVVADYLDAYGAQLPGYRVGIYGGADLVDWCIVNGHASFGWVASASAWSHGHTSAHACLRQRYPGGTVGGFPVDFDDVLQADWGQWAAVEPDPTPAPEDDDMASVQELIIHIGQDGKPDTGQVLRTYPDAGVYEPVTAAAYPDVLSELNVLGFTLARRQSVAPGSSFIDPNVPGAPGANVREVADLAAFGELKTS